MVRKTRIINVNSRREAGAVGISSDGSSFSVKFADPIKIPQASNAMQPHNDPP